MAKLLGVITTSFCYCLYARPVQSFWLPPPSSSPSASSFIGRLQHQPSHGSIHYSWRRKTPCCSSSSRSSSSSSSSSANTGSGWRGSPSSSDDIINISGDGGVIKRVIRPGYGYNQEVPPLHAYVKIAFVMKTDTGVIIADRMNKPMEFMMGLERPEVIPGWELALATMKPNEIAEIVCRPEYAFGPSEGYEDRIPPGSTIVTRMQLLNWRSLKGAGSTDVQDTHELSKKWRAELDEGISPMTEWAGAPSAAKSSRPPPSSSTPPPPPQGVNAKPSSFSPSREEVEEEERLRRRRSSGSSSSNRGGGDGPLADAQAAMAQQASNPITAAASSSERPEFTDPFRPFVEEFPEDAPKPRIDIDDPEAAKRLNPNQVVIGTAPQYKWKERQGYLELVVPVPDEVRKEDVLFHVTPRVLMVGFRNVEGKENWIVGGDLFGPIEVESTFWVLSKDFQDELTEGKTCIEVRIEKKMPMKRIWGNVFKDQ